jgi:hypothetical protein
MTRTPARKTDPVGSGPLQLVRHGPVEHRPPWPAAGAKAGSSLLNYGPRQSGGLRRRPLFGTGGPYENFFCQSSRARLGNEAVDEQ